MLTLTDRPFATMLAMPAWRLFCAEPPPGGGVDEPPPREPFPLLPLPPHAASATATTVPVSAACNSPFMPDSAKKILGRRALSCGFYLYSADAVTGFAIRVQTVIRDFRIPYAGDGHPRPLRPFFRMQLRAAGTSCRSRGR